MYAAPQLIALRAKGAATGDHQRLDATPSAKCLDHLGHLHGEFTRGSKHQGLHSLEAGINSFNQRETKGEGLAGTSTGLADDITAIEQVGQDFSLDRGRGCNPHDGQRLQCGIAEPVFAERDFFHGGRSFNFERSQNRSSRATPCCGAGDHADQPTQGYG
jgi:hypothetical protein